MQLTQQRLDEIFAAHQNSNFKLLLSLSKQLQIDFPDFVLGYKAAGVALNALNRKTEAIQQMQKAIKLAPKDDEALSNLGQMILDTAETQAQWKNAEMYLLKASKLNPKSAVIWNNLSGCAIKLNKANQAKNYALKAINLQANYEYAYNNLGVAYLALSDYELAKTAILNALKINPTLADAYNNLSAIYEKQSRYISALEASRKAMENDKNNVTFIANYANLLKNIGDIEQALIVLENALQKFPHRFLLLQKSLAIESYSKDTSVERISEKIQKLKQWYELNFYQNFEFSHFKKNKTRQNKTLRIGFVSGDFRNHAVAKFLLNLFPQLKNNRQIEMFAYSNCSQKQEDDITQRLKKYFAKYRNISTLSDLEVANIIYKDKIQILFDLSGHTDRNRLEMFALKPAPIQISWIGWLGTTGIPTMDYFLADEFCVPSGEKYEQQFSEKVLRMPHIWEVLTPPEFPREIQKNFYKSRGNENFMFASFNNPNKVNSKTLDLWSEVLKKSPENTEFHWYRGDFQEQDLQKKFLAEFQIREINTEKIKIEPTFTSDEYFEKLQNVDLILDTFPFTGMTTTAEALSLGTPTLTMLGNLMPHRFSGTCINSIGDENLNKNFIFDNENDFVNQAVFFANNKEKLNELKNGLAEKARKSPLCDAELFAKNFEIKMWEVWNKFLQS